MELKFKNQDFQSEAVNAVADLFTGQEKRYSTFSVSHEPQMNLLQNDFGIGNALLISDETFLANMHSVQKKRNLPKTEDLENRRTKTRIITQTADIHIQHAGVSHIERDIRFADIRDDYSILPNLLTIVGEQCLIKRETVNRILQESGRIIDFINNPQLFMEAFTEIVKNNRHQLAIDGIRYVKLDGEEYYVQEIFNSAKLIANLDKNAVAVQNSVYDYIIYDSDTVERPFAVALDKDPDVKMFFKIPSHFKIETPIGSYNPDWAVYIDRDGVKKMYFVLETKGSTNLFDLRTAEQLKIHCGKQHFKALENGTELRVAKTWSDFKMKG